MSISVPLKFHIARGILAVLFLLCIVAIGSAIHDYSETRDSLIFWQAKLEEERLGSKTKPGFDSPAGRVRRLEEHLESIPQSLLAPGICLVLFGGLLYLSSAKVRESIMKSPAKDVEKSSQD